MVRTIALLAFLLVSSNGMAQAVPAAYNPCDNIAEATKNKTSTQINTILETCRNAETAASLLPEITAENATEWSTAAKGFAEALGIAAKELGVATNDFLTSPAGILLTLILLFNFAGGALIGIPFTMFTLWLFFTLARNTMSEKIEYENIPILWGALHYRRRKSETRADSISEGQGSTLILSGIGLVLLNAIVWFNVT